MGTVSGARQKTSLGGLTLAELMLSLGLLAIIAIIVAGVFTHLLNASAKTSDLTAGRLLAQQLLDKAVRESRTTRYEGQVDLKTHHSDAQTNFFYVVEPTRLSSDTGITGLNRDFYFLEVEVSWFGDDHDAARSSPEMGRLSTKVSQTVGYEL